MSGVKENSFNVSGVKEHSFKELRWIIMRCGDYSSEAKFIFYPKALKEEVECSY